MNAKPTKDRTILDSIGKTYEPPKPADEVENPVGDRCGVAVKHAMSGIVMIDSEGEHHGILYGALRSTIRLNREQTHLWFVFEQFDGDYEVHIVGTGLATLHRQMTLQQRVTLNCGELVTGIKVVKREESEA